MATGPGTARALNRQWRLNASVQETAARQTRRAALLTPLGYYATSRCRTGASFTSETCVTKCRSRISMHLTELVSPIQANGIRVGTSNVTHPLFNQSVVFCSAFIPASAIRCLSDLTVLLWRGRCPPTRPRAFRRYVTNGSTVERRNLPRPAFFPPQSILCPHSILDGSHLRKDGDRDLRRRMAPDPQPDRALQALQLLPGQIEVFSQAFLAALAVDVRAQRTDVECRRLKCHQQDHVVQLGACVVATTAVCGLSLKAIATSSGIPARRGAPATRH